MLRFCGRALTVLALTCAAASASSQTTTYTYDALGRVVWAVESAGPAVNYAYDAAGNRLSLSDGAPSVELTVKAFTASSNAGGFTGLTALKGMRDQAFATKATSHVTTSESSAWILADLGASQSLNRVDLAGPDGAVVAGGAAALTGAVVEISDDGATWTMAATVGTVTPGVYKTISLGDGKARYVRLRRTNGLVGVGDFRLYSGGLLANRSPVTVEDQVEAPKDKTLVFDPRFNDRDPDGDALSITAAGSGASHGQVTFTTTAITYKPDLGYEGTDRFAYTVIDTQGATAVGQVTVTVKDVPNRPPLVRGADWATEVGLANDFTVVASDPDNDALSLVLPAATTAGGTLTPLGGLTFRYVPPANYAGADRFVLRIQDAKGLSTIADASVFVYRPSTANHPPVAFDDKVTTSKGQALVYDPRGNDTDVDHDILTITAVQRSTAQGGTVTRAIDGSNLIYDPADTFTGQDEFTYTIGDGYGGSSTAKVTVTVVGSTNTAPRANSDTWRTPLNATVGADVRQNDGDPDGDLLTIISVRQPAHGSAGIFLSGKWVTYTPAAGYVGDDSFSYTVSDGRGGTADAAVTVTVTDTQNRLPTGIAQSYTIPPNQSFTFDPTVGAKDLDEDPITVSTIGLDDADPLSLPQGVISRASAGPTNDEMLSKLVTYTPPTGKTEFTVKGFYVLYDGHGGGQSALTPFTIHVSDTALVDAPVAQAVKMTVPHEGEESVNVPVLGSYSTLELAQAPPSGNVFIAGNVVTYKAAPNFSGDADFTVRARGAGGLGPAALVDVTVGARSSAPLPPDNANPVANNDTVSDVAYGTARTIYVLDNDYDPDGDALTLNPVLPSPPSHGQAQVSGSAIIYTPISGYAGSDSFIYRVSNGRGGTAIATVNVTTRSQANQSPVLAMDRVTTAYGQALTVDVLANDYDPEGDRISLLRVSKPDHGTAAVVDNTVIYTPVAGYAGSDNFNYWVADGRSYGEGSSVVIVTVLGPPNTSPLATADSYVVAFNTPAYLAVRDNDNDPDGDALTIASVTAPAHGTAIIVDGQITYTPTSGYSGSDAFTYTVSDGKGGSASASVTITVRPQPNRPPAAVDDAVVTVVNVAKTVAVLANDSDPDGDGLSIASVTQPAHGTAVIADGKITYVPADGYLGADSFTYAVSDGRGASASATVSITVTPNHAPTPADDAATTYFNTAKTIAVLANDTDPDGDVLSIASVTQPAHGTAAIADGKVTYTPNTGYAGPDAFTYAVSDGRGGQASATVNVTVKPANRAPTAVDDSYVVVRGKAKALTPRGNDTDPDSDPLAITAVTTPGHGTALIASGGATVIYTPASDYAGADAFAYTISDGHGGTASANVTLSVVANRPPVPVDDYAQMSPGGSAPPLFIDVLANDSDPDGDALSLSFVLGGEPGSYVVSNSGGKVKFESAGNPSGVWPFDYVVRDPGGSQAGGSVTVYVSKVVWSQDDTLVAQANTTTTFSLANDLLANDRGLSVGALSPDRYLGQNQPRRGTVSVDYANKTLSYTPNAGFVGTDTFSYTVSDGQGGSGGATVTIKVVASNGNRPPKAGPAYMEVAAGTPTPMPQLLSQASDPDGDPLTISVPADQTTTKIVNGVLVYTPPYSLRGPSYFVYTLSDGKGGVTSAGMSLFVRPNAAPKGGDDSYVVQADQATPMAVLANDSDANGDDLTISAIASPPAHGVVQIVGGKSLSYTALEGYSGSDSLAYTITDGNGGAVTVTVSINVTGPS